MNVLMLFKNNTKKKNVMAGWLVVGQGLCMLDSAAESFPLPNLHPLPRRVANTELTITDSDIDS